jgi:hypothetical protein
MRPTILRGPVALAFGFKQMFRDEFPARRVPYARYAAMAQQPANLWQPPRLANTVDEREEIPNENRTRMERRADLGRRKTSIIRTQLAAATSLFGDDHAFVARVDMTWALFGPHGSDR